MEMNAPTPPDSRPSFSSGRRWIHRLNLVAGVLALAALLLMVNYLSGGHYARYNVDALRSSRLSPQTLRVLDRLTNQVNITIFFNRNAEETLYSLTASLLAEYKHAKPAFINVATLDYTRLPSEAQQLLARLKLSGLEEKNFVIFECAGRTKICLAKNLSHYDFSGLVSGESREVRRDAFQGEMLFTSAIFSVTHSETLKACFLTGHGEANPSEGGGYSKFASILKDELNVDWTNITLIGTNAPLADCQLLIIAGPRLGGLLPVEIEKIDNYLRKGGGRLLLLLNNQQTNTGVESILVPWGVEALDDRVLERTEDCALSPDGSDFFNWGYTSHPIMNPIINEGSHVRFSAPRAFNFHTNAQTPGAPILTLLAFSSPKSVLDRPPYPTNIYHVAVAIEQNVIQGVGAPRGGTRIVATGDATMFSNSRLNTGGNHDFAYLALIWLLERPEYLLDGLAPRPIHEYRLFLTQSQRLTVKVLFGLGLPGAILLVGGLVWLRRRS